MAKSKKTLRERNEAKLSELIKQPLSGKGGFLPAHIKEFIAREMINSATNNGKAITKRDTLQKRFNKYEDLYIRLFNEGLEGQPQTTTTIEKEAFAAKGSGSKYFIKEKGVRKEVTAEELAYKIELLSHKLSVQYDAVFTKLAPSYKVIGKGKYEITYQIPDLSEISEEDTVEEIVEFLASNGIHAVVSDVGEGKTAEVRAKAEERKKARVRAIERNKSKYYKLWKGKKEGKGRRKK